MDRDAVFTTLKQAAAEVLGVEETTVTEEARFKDDLDADSLDLVELVMALEEAFDVEVPEDELDVMRELVTREMVAPWAPREPPLAVDVGVGRTWLEAK